VEFARFEDFQDTLMQHLPGALPDSVRQTFFTHARRFYRRSRVWRVTIPGLCVTPEAYRFPLNPVDQYADVCFVEGARLGRFPLSVTDGPDPWMTTGRPSRIWMPDLHNVEVWPLPTEHIEETLTVEVSVQPRRDANHLPPEALTHHYEALVSGVLGDMMFQPKKPYTDAAMAALHARRFETEVSRAVSIRLRSNAERSLPSRPPVVALR
jgi:hypothetical protein